MLDKYMIYVDLDGVLANLDGKVFDITGKYLPSSNRFPKHESRKDWIEEVNNYCVQWNSDRSFWGGLKRIPQSKFLWDYVKPYKPAILTCLPEDCPGKPENKKRWVYNVLGEDIKVLVTKNAPDKPQLYASFNSILIDDNEETVKLWRDFDGIGIHHKSVFQTLEILQTGVENDFMDYRG